MGAYNEVKPNSNNDYVDDGNSKDLQHYGEPKTLIRRFQGLQISLLS